MSLAILVVLRLAVRRCRRVLLLLIVAAVALLLLLVCAVKAVALAAVVVVIRHGDFEKEGSLDVGGIGIGSCRELCLCLWRGRGGKRRGWLGWRSQDHTRL